MKIQKSGIIDGKLLDNLDLKVIDNETDVSTVKDLPSYGDPNISPELLEEGLENARKANNKEIEESIGRLKHGELIDITNEKF